MFRGKITILFKYYISILPPQNYENLPNLFSTDLGIYRQSVSTSNNPSITDILTGLLLPLMKLFESSTSLFVTPKHPALWHK